MTKFHNGPAAGVILQLSRAPIYLRAAVGDGQDGQWDALDRLDDFPEPGETLYAYRRIGPSVTMHISGSDKSGKRFGRWLEGGDYKLCAEQPSQETMRENVSWTVWTANKYDEEADEIQQESENAGAIVAALKLAGRVT